MALGLLDPSVKGLETQSGQPESCYHGSTMKTVLSLSALSLCAPLLAAPSLEEAFSQAAAAVVPARAESQAPAAAPAPRETYAEVNSCWTRPPQAEADALGLPSRICIKRAGVAVEPGWDLPFSDKGALMVEGEPSSGRFHVSGGAREADGWNIVAEIWSHEKPAACGELNLAFAAVYVDIDAAGHILPARPVVRGFLMDGSSLCAGPARSVELLYTPAG